MAADRTADYSDHGLMIPLNNSPLLCRRIDSGHQVEGKALVNCVTNNIKSPVYQTYTLTKEISYLPRWEIAM